MTQSHTKPTSCFSTYSHALENNCRTGGEIQFDLLYQFPAVGHEPRFKALPRLYPCLPAETFFVRVEKMPPARGGRNQYPVIRKRLFRIEIERENKIEVKKEDDGGYTITFTLFDRDTDMMKISIYVVDSLQLETVKQNFINDPVKVYSSIITSLTV